MKTMLKFLFIVVLVSLLSFFSSNIWGGKPEKLPDHITIIYQDDMTVKMFAESNNIPKSALKKIFGLSSPDDLNKNLSEFEMSSVVLEEKVNKAMAIESENESKNWFKIPLKFALWLIFLVVLFVLMVKNKINSKNRKWLYLVSFMIFGVVLGADPSPMGTVKDAVVLFGSKWVIFPPRMVALSIFLLTVVLANKFICSWGCQIGTLQDFIFRLNRNEKDTASGNLGYVKLSFKLTNTIRVLFFAALCFAAFRFSYDITESIDPFKIFKPQTIGIYGGMFIGTILALSIFIYRPWCLMFCPFGLVGWVFEKISIFKINVDYEKCISCKACEKACPSTVMSAILRRDKVIPDCFSCNNCVNVCPVNAVKFKAGRREKPDEGKFD